MRFSKAVNIAELREVARARVPKFVFDYVDGAVEDEIGMARNRAALDAARIVPRYLVDVSNRDQTTPLFGRTYAAPIGIAPVGLANLNWPGADTILARTAAAADIPYVLSTAATTSIEDAAEAAGGNFWFQLYAPNEISVREDLLRRADQAGAEVLVLTVDVPLASNRERDRRNGLTLPFKFTGRHAFDAFTRPAWSAQVLRHGNPRFEVLAPYADPKAGTRSLTAFAASQLARVLTWDDFDRIRESWPRKLVVKGLMAAGDAVLARDRGADGIILSNHGGRQLDAAPAPIECLAGVRRAVGDSFTVMVDSGVRRGTDIARLMAAGADFVFTGRAMLYGVAAAGPAGAEKALSILLDELDLCLGQIGCPSIAGLREAEIHLEPPAAAPNRTENRNQP
jgi:L-lactate dehydrogenase (cytochrome)/(S)-mandelate dehydrogenase